MKQGLLLINLGTPIAPNVRYVRRYLREFLSDPRVIDLAFIWRFMLLYFFILPLRPRQSASAYQKIWQPQGSPLLIYSQRLLAKVQKKLNHTTQVALGMRYGEPSIATALQQLNDCDHITIFPLYPQFSSAASGSSIEKVLTIIAKKPIQPNITVIRDFYQQPCFINAQAALIEPYLDNQDFFLFSYHGIPERHLTKTCCKTVCSKACDLSSRDHKACYRAQCYQTSANIAKQLNLPTQSYDTSFQSRLGRTPWIKPYTDLLLPKLIQQGIKRLVVICPSFVADCLETIEEMGIRARQQWLSLGGDTFTLIPCVNDDDRWAQAIISICKLG